MSHADNLNDRGGYDPDDLDDDYYSRISVDELINTAMSNIDVTDRWGGEYISKGGLLKGVSVDPMFWEKLADFKQIEIPHDKRNNFFSCSC